MARYRKKPVVIEAYQWTRDERQQTPEWMDKAIVHGTVWFDGDFMCIRTLEGVMTASDDDWIIQGIQGEIYPCKPDIFEATYGLVTDEAIV